MVSAFQLWFFRATPLETVSLLDLYISDASGDDTVDASPQVLTGSALKLNSFSGIGALLAFYRVYS